MHRQGPPVGRQHPPRGGLDLHLGPLSPLLEANVLNVGQRYANERAGGLEHLDDLAVEDNPRAEQPFGFQSLFLSWAWPVLTLSG
jgi:hypothetical protein